MKSRPGAASKAPDRVFGEKKGEQAMRETFSWVSAASLLLGLSLIARAEDMAAVYLKDGKLTGRLEVCQFQGGIVGFTGVYHVIDPDGAWSAGTVMNGKKEEPKAKGKLHTEQLAELANELAKYDLANLPNHGEPHVNPKVIRIQFGNNVSELQLAYGKSSTKEDKAIRVRYKGVVAAVTMLCVAKK